MKKNITPEFLDVHQAAQLLSVSIGTIRRWSQNKSIEGVKVGLRGDWRFTEKNLLKMIRKGRKQKVLTFIKRFLKENASNLQQRATKHHKDFLKAKKLRTEYIEKYVKSHIRIVNAFANNLQYKNLKKGQLVFNRIGEKLGKESIRDGLTLEEAVDGTIFLKQAIWERLHEEGLLERLTKEEFYEFSQVIGTYCDIVSSKIAFSYHQQYQHQMEKDLAIREKLERQKDEFIGIATHELKTPLTSIKAYAQVLLNKFSKVGDEKSAVLLMKMDAQLNKFNMLITDLLDVNKMDTGRLQLHGDWFDINELVNEIVEQMQLTTENQRIIKKLGVTTTTYADRDRVGQVLINLISNAIKYAPESDSIVVKVTVSKENVIIGVQDFGIGIPKEHQDKVFERFFRISDERQKTYPGMGLGLFISKEIVTRQGGRIWIESEPNKGATFYFSLPVKK